VVLWNRYVCNVKGESIDSFQLEDLAKCNHLENGTKNIYNKLLGEFKHTSKDLCHICYMQDKKFKLRHISGYPTTTLRKPYQYMVSMLCMLLLDNLSRGGDSTRESVVTVLKQLWFF
jgi:hypothetical protein